MKSGKSIILLTLLILCVCTFIFTNSLETPAVSAGRSNRVKNLVLRLFPFLGKIEPGTLSTLVRKAAHLAEFMFLSFFITLYFYKYKAHKLLALLMGLIVASMDEAIQLLIPGRGPAVKDVLIDFTGFFLGFIIIVLIKRTGGKDNGQCQNNRSV